MSDIDEKIADRRQELIRFGEEVKRTVYDPRTRDPFYVGDHGVDYELAYQWGASCLNLLGRVFGKNSAYHENFDAQSDKLHLYSRVQQALGIMKAARDDYEQGSLLDVRTLIEAEVFDDFLKQGAHLLDSGSYQPAAVIVGSVLEDGLRKLCAKQEIELSPRPILETMNAALVKSGANSKLTQKRVTALADIRNRVAHGEWDEFTNADVDAVLRDVRQFMETRFA